MAVETIERLRERSGQVVIVDFADGVPENELRAIPNVQSLESQRDGSYHLKIAGSIDPVIKALASSIRRRRPPKLLREVQVLEPNGSQHHAGDAFRRECRQDVPPSRKGMLASSLKRIGHP